MFTNYFFSSARIGIIAKHTFTQLSRMKVFYFLVAFALLIVGASFFEMPGGRIASDSAEQDLRMVKSTAMGAMSLFSVIFAIAATALLLPKDVEDRTLYTILCKPVPRIDYLLGKLLGVLALIFLSIALMDILLTGILYFRTESIISSELANAAAAGFSSEQVAYYESIIRQQGPTWDLQFGVLAIFLKAAVIASIALLVSSFSTSTLFTIAISVLVYFIGHFTADARDYWLYMMGDDFSMMSKWMSQLAVLIFPDFQLYNIIDHSIEGKNIPANVIGRLSLLTVFYCGIYSILAWFCFRKKEF
ncbi:ABC transporter permease [Persicirhabdus sediminis]|uniref:ABC transporter permease subunit n=1 Tax=Persicirhabdus sediminis TaxID=454144 RepID=A0A8J7MAD3_9BACT|nr:ABC transporter permease subunit [Persicirhabdus sediminis]MBK1789864.1 ABC transporter permease subunit [Persicirhabdus sediminis]